MNPIKAALTACIVYLLEKINTGFLNWHAAVNVEDYLWCIPVVKEHQSKLLSIGKLTTPFPISLNGYVFSLLWHNFANNDLDKLNVPKDNTLVHYMEDIILIKMGKQKVDTP